MRTEDKIKKCWILRFFEELWYNTIESKFDDIDVILIPGFKLVSKNRLFNRKASGGVAALVSEKISNNVINLNVKQQDSIWLKYKCGNEVNDMIICLAYIPPEDSIYSKMFIFNEIDEHINDLQAKKRKH